MKVLVTGASRGIGRAIAVALAGRGASVAVHYHRNAAAAQETLAALAGSGHREFAADLADPAQAERLWQSASAAMGKIDVLINNAGIYFDHPPLEASPAEWLAAWQQTLNANLVAPAHLSYFAARAMAQSGGGRIVNISSRGAFRGEPRAPAYGAAKAGLNSLSQSMALHLAPHRVYVYCLAPGWVTSDMTAEYLKGAGGAAILAQHPLGRVATPEEIAATAVFCALDAPAAMTGSIIDINGASYLRT